MDKLKLLWKIEEKLFLPVALASLFIMSALTTFDAGTRYILKISVTGIYEITEKYLMVLCFYFAINHAYKEGSNISVTFLVTRLPKRIRLFTNYFIQIVAILFCLVLFVASLIWNIPLLGDKLVLVNYSIPLMPVYIVVPMGLLILILRMIVDLWQIKYGKSGLFKDGTSDSDRI